MSSNQDLKRRREPENYLPVGPTKRIQVENRGATGPCMREKIAVIWMKQVAAPFRPMSLSVICQVCTYLGFISKLVNLRSKHVICFDIFSQEWEVLFLVNNTVTALYCYNYLNEDSLFIGMVNQGTMPIPPAEETTLLLKSSGNTARKVSFHMLEKKRLRDICTKLVNCWEPGLLYDAKRKCMYFFGGSDTEGEHVRASCKFTFGTAAWTHLPDMSAARANFVPCWHYQVVYLCSGTTQQVEMFDPALETFSVCPVILVSPTNEHTTSLSASIDDKLCLLACDQLIVYNTRTGQERRDSEKVPRLELKGPPVVCGEVMYCLDAAKNQVWMFELHLGKNSKQIEIPYYFD